MLMKLTLGFRPIKPIIYMLEIICFNNVINNRAEWLIRWSNYKFKSNKQTNKQTNDIVGT